MYCIEQINVVEAGFKIIGYFKILGADEYFGKSN